MRYDLILFDVDGVFLSEERCFDTSALVVWELLHAPHFLGISGESFTVKPSETEIRRIRQDVFQDNRVLDWMKDRGINANWDMVYLVFTVQLFLLCKKIADLDRKRVQQWMTDSIKESTIQEIRQTVQEFSISFQPDYQGFIEFFDESKKKLNREELLVSFNKIAENWFGIPVTQFSRNSELWLIGQSVFQEWYLGEELYWKVEGQASRISGRSGFLYQEIALAQPEKIASVLGKLVDHGIELGIGTGRPAIETEVPLKQLGFYSFFHPKRIISASDVVQAEEKFPSLSPLGKPGPYTYVKGYLGRDVSDEVCLSTLLPLSGENKVLIVGDSVADYLAARKMGCDFAATLTGLTGQKARKKFEELKADYILNDVTEVLDILEID